MATASRSRPLDAPAIDLVPVQRVEKRSAGAISFAECKFILSFVLFVCFVTTLPYMVGHFVSYPGTVFTGIIEHSADTNNYLSYANQAARGKWLFRNQMTGEPHGEVFFNLEWLLIGKIAALLHVSLPVGLSILRLFCVLAMGYGVYWLSSFFLKTVFLARRVAMVAIMTGGGFGWIAALHLLHVPIDSSYFLDLTAALQFPFYWGLKLPHFLVSETFVVLGLCLFLRAESRERLGDYLVAGAFYLASGEARRPYDMLFLMCATGLYIAIDIRARLHWTLLRRALPIFMSVPLLGYEFWIFKIHPVFRWWSLPGLPPPEPLAVGIKFRVLIRVVRGCGVAMETEETRPPWHVHGLLPGACGAVRVHLSLRALLISIRHQHCGAVSHAGHDRLQRRQLRAGGKSGRGERLLSSACWW